VTRRQVVGVCAAARIGNGKDLRAPVDPEVMNRFAAAYGKYVGSLNDGILDPRQWEDVEKAWGKIQRSIGGSPRQGVNELRGVNAQ
jgi:hypothetical protein